MSKIQDWKIEDNSFKAVSSGKFNKDTLSLQGVSLVTVGEALGHFAYVEDDFLPIEFDKTSLSQIKKVLKDKEEIPAKANHTDDIRAVIGKWHSFRVKDDKLLADVSFLRSREKTANHIVEMAESMPKSFGISLVLTPNKPDVLDGKALYRIKNVHGADFVDIPSANKDGLFKAKNINTNQEIEMTKEEISNLVKESLKEQFEAIQEDSKNQISELFDNLKPNTQENLEDQEIAEFKAFKQAKADQEQKNKKAEELKEIVKSDDFKSVLKEAFNIENLASAGEKPASKSEDGKTKKTELSRDEFINKRKAELFNEDPKLSVMDRYNKALNEFKQLSK